MRPWAGVASALQSRSIVKVVQRIDQVWPKPRKGLTVKHQLEGRMEVRASVIEVQSRSTTIGVTSARLLILYPVIPGQQPRNLRKKAWSTRGQRPTRARHREAPAYSALSACTAISILFRFFSFDIRLRFLLTFLNSGMQDLHSPAASTGSGFKVRPPRNPEARLGRASSTYWNWTTSPRFQTGNHTSVMSRCGWKAVR